MPSLRCPPLQNREVIYVREPIPHNDRLDQRRSYCLTLKRGPVANAGRCGLMTDRPSVSPQQQVPNY